MSNSILEAMEGMSVVEMDAILKALRETKKNVQGAENARYAELGRPLVETLITEHGVEASEYSSRVGVSSSSLPITIDGKEYTYYVSIKDVKASEKREKDVESGKVVLKKRAKKGDTES